MELRPYQLAALTQLEQLEFAGVKHPLIVAPTGAGKTVIAAEIIRRRAGQRGLFLAPRRELIHQTCRKLDAFDIPYGVILAGDRRTNLYAQVQVASVDTLISRALRRQKLHLEPFDYIIRDEAHVGLTEIGDKLMALWPEASVIGLTATPCRSDGKAMGRVYDELIEVATVAELVAQGFLVPQRYYSVSEPDLRSVRTTAGDYNRGDLDAVMNRTQLVGDIVQHWLQHAATRRTAVFATSIAHSVALAEQFIREGVAAEHVDANTPQNSREATFERFASGRTQVLTNCTLASIGFDLPELDCVVFARPTKSLGLYLQMLGRGLRPAPGKRDCLVLDHAGNVHRHGFATDDRCWTLHGKYALDEKKTERAKQQKEAQGLVQRSCPQCCCLWEGPPVCPQCGWFPPPKAKAIDTHDGELVEISKPKEWTVDRKRLFFLELAGYGELKGYRPGWAANKYNDRFKEWPARSWKQHVEKWGALDPSMETLRYIRSRQIAYSRARARTARAVGNA